MESPRREPSRGRIRAFRIAARGTHGAGRVNSARAWNRSFNFRDRAFILLTHGASLLARSARLPFRADGFCRFPRGREEARLAQPGRRFSPRTGSDCLRSLVQAWRAWDAAI